MKGWSNSETRICLQFSLFSFVLKFRICHKVHQRKCKFGSKSKSSWHWLCSPIVLHCSHFILFQFKGCLGNVQQPHQFCTGRGHFEMMMISFLTFQFHQYQFRYTFAINYRPPSIHFQFILSALGLFLAVKSFEPFEITIHFLRKIQFLAIFSSSSAQGEIIFPGCWELAITTAVKHISAPQNLQS